MTQKTLHLCLRSLLLVCLATAAAGCSQTTLSVTRYPSFWNYETNYNSIAVAPTFNQWERGVFEGAVGNRIARDLANNGTYTVYDHTSDNADQNTILYNAQASNEADLVLFTTITGYDVSDRKETRYETVETTVYVVDEYGHFVYDDYGNKIVDHIEREEIPYPWFIREASSSMNMSVVRTSDAAQVYSTSFSGGCSDEAGHPHELSSHQSLQKCAISDMTDGAISPLVPVRLHLTVDKDEIMKIAAETDKGWVTGKKFSVEVPQLLFQFTLPKAAKYNTFTCDIIVDGDEEGHVLQSYDFVWEGESLQFYVDAQALLATGATKFTARFWSGKSLSFETDFKFK